MAGTGEFASVPEACNATIRETETIMPRTAESEIYANGYDTYRALYPALRPIYTKIAG
jgi:xylulokinase